MPLRVHRDVSIALWVCVLVLTTIAVPPLPRLVWNASASAPIGLYALSPGTAPRTGDMVVTRMPRAYRSLAARRNYLPFSVPLVKRVAAEPGDIVCTANAEILINGVRAATRLRQDAEERSMPWWRGCLTLQHGALFLLMDTPESFDSRYFGPVSRPDLIGVATPLWTTPALPTRHE